MKCSSLLQEMAALLPDILQVFIMPIAFSERRAYEDCQQSHLESPQNSPRGNPRRVHVDSLEVVGSGVKSAHMVVLFGWIVPAGQPLPPSREELVPCLIGCDYSGDVSYSI